MQTRELMKDATEHYVKSVAPSLSDKSLYLWLDSYRNGFEIGYHAIKEMHGTEAAQRYREIYSTCKRAKFWDAEYCDAYERSLLVSALIDIITDVNSAFTPAQPQTLSLTRSIR